MQFNVILYKFNWCHICTSILILHKEYLSILYNVLKEQEGNKIKNIEEYTEDTSFHKEGNRTYVCGYVTNNDREKILTKIWMDLLYYIPYDNDFLITINEIEHFQI